MKSIVPKNRSAWKPPKRKRVSPKVLKDIVGRVVAASQPEKIILFGSAARGTMGPHSDVDLLVIKGGKYNRGKITEKIYLQLSGEDESVDIVVVTPEEVELYRDVPYLVISPAMNEGKVLYAK